MTLSWKFFKTAAVSLTLAALASCGNKVETQNGQIVENFGEVFKDASGNYIRVAPETGTVRLDFKPKSDIYNEGVIVNFREDQFCSFTTVYKSSIPLCKNFADVKDPGNKQLINNLRGYLKVKPVQPKA